MSEKYLDQLLSRYPSLVSCRDDIYSAFVAMKEAFAAGGKLLVAGNGGSSSDSDHIVGDLMKGFKSSRELPEDRKKALLEADPEMGGVLAVSLQGALPAISLSEHSALNTAYANDCDPKLVFAQQVNAYGRRGDVLLAISTSGNSRNILYASVAAKAAGMKVVGLTGSTGGKLASYADCCIRVPAEECYMVQELHLPVYHALCLMLEEYFF